jgi:hypothetical protein
MVGDLGRPTKTFDAPTSVNSELSTFGVDFKSKFPSPWSGDQFSVFSIKVSLKGTRAMDDQTKAGYDLMAELFEALRLHEHSLFEQGLKVQALEFTLRSFPDGKPVYEKSLAEFRTPEVVRKHELAQRLSRERVAAIRAGRFPSA